MTNYENKGDCDSPVSHSMPGIMQPQVHISSEHNTNTLLFQFKLFVIGKDTKRPRLIHVKTYENKGQWLLQSW